MMNPKGAFKYHNHDYYTKWQTKEAIDELEANVEKYFIQAKKLNEVPTIQGLQLHLNVNGYTWYSYLYRKHSIKTDAVLRVEELFNRAKLFIEVTVLHHALDKDNDKATWYLSKYKDYSPNYNPKQEIDLNKAKELNEEDIETELLLLEQKEKELTGDDK